MARKILLADDSVTAQNMGRKILADAGYDVVTVNNGSAALKRIAELKPDLIVLDVYMPGYSGLEVCQRLKDAEETAHIPVLLTVGKLEPFKPDEARRVRADAHIVKPFEASELLTAITRLEDRMVPQHSEGSRFSASVAGVERFGGDGNGRKRESEADADTGWKSRLRFPSKKKKVAEPEDVAAGAAFRDFRRGKGKASAGGAVPAKQTPPEQDPEPVPDIPHDITPEELDALSALAAKLDRPTAGAEDTPPAAEQGVETPAPVVDCIADCTADRAVDPTAPAVEGTFDVAPATIAVEGKAEFEIPVENTEPVVNMEPAVEVAPVVAVNAASLAQEQAPVDRNDEPMFASAASGVEQVAEEGMAGKPSEVEEPAPSDAELGSATPADTR